MKLLSICFALCCSLSLLAQVPQAIAYQAVATDLDGNELIEQNIQIKATVISQGLELWVETHQTQTDEFGLFVIEIGKGTRIAGSNANFEDISWFADDHFLKIDMDPAGGNNFEFVGTTQMLSVPYAFQTKRAANADVADQAVYADSAGFAINDMDTSPTNELQDINYDPMTGTFSITGGNSFVLDTDDQDSDPTNEIQTLAFDGVNISLLDADGNVTNSVDLSQFAFAGPGSNFDFPQGMIGEPVLLQSGSFTVPNGKVLYLTSADREIILNGKMHPTTPNMPAVPQGNTIDNCQCTGMLFDVTPTVDVKFHDFNAASTLIVPQNKILFLKSGLLGDDPAIIEVNNITMTFARANDTRGTRIPIFPEGTILSRPLIIPSMSITYYLIDKL